MEGSLVSIVTRAYLDPAYLRFRDDFDSVLDPRTHSIEWLDAQVWLGKAKVWGDDRACALTEIRHFPAGTFEVHVMIAAGSLKILVSEIMPEIQLWKDEIGALFVSVASRMAWIRLLEPLGFRVWQTEVRD